MGLAGAISGMLDRPAQAAAMGLRGYDKWNTLFRTPVIAAEMEVFFERLLRER